MSVDRRSFVKKISMSVLATTGGATLLSAHTGASAAAPTSERFGQVTAPKTAVPRGACDCHVHVFEPRRFEYVLPRTYTPGEASLDDLSAFLARLGLDRVVLVQPSSYGADNRCLLDALGRLGPHRARGIAVVDLAKVTPRELDELRAAGVRGLRLNLEVRGERDAKAASSALQRARQVVAGTGLAIQVYADIGLIEAVADDLATLGVPVLLDHFAGLRAERGTEQPGFAALMSLLRSGNAYVKLSAPYRASKQGPGFADVKPLAQALIGAAPNRMLWGSDWPHTGSSSSRSGDLSQVEPFRPEDAGRTLDLLTDWTPDAGIRRQILVDNPAALFGFAA